MNRIFHNLSQAISFKDGMHQIINREMKSSDLFHMGNSEYNTLVRSGSDPCPVSKTLKTEKIRTSLSRKMTSFRSLWPP